MNDQNLLRFDGFYVCFDPLVKNQENDERIQRWGNNSYQIQTKILLFFPNGSVGLAMGDHDTKWEDLSRIDSCYKSVQRCVFEGQNRWESIFDRSIYIIKGKKIIISCEGLVEAKGTIKKDSLDLVRFTNVFDLWELYEFIQFKSHHIPPTTPKDELFN